MSDSPHLYDALKHESNVGVIEIDLLDSTLLELRETRSLLDPKGDDTACREIPSLKDSVA